MFSRSFSSPVRPNFVLAATRGAAYERPPVPSTIERTTRPSSAAERLTNRPSRTSSTKTKLDENSDRIRIFSSKLGPCVCRVGVRPEKRFSFPRRFPESPPFFESSALCVNTCSEWLLHLRLHRHHRGHRYYSFCSILFLRFLRILASWPNSLLKKFERPPFFDGLFCPAHARMNIRYWIKIREKKRDTHARFRAGKYPPCSGRINYGSFTPS